MFFVKACNWVFGHLNVLHLTNPTIILKINGVAKAYFAASAGEVSLESAGGSNLPFSIKYNASIPTLQINSTGSKMIGGSSFIEERAAANGSLAGYGQIWIKNTTPCELWYTDDAGGHHQIAFV